MRPPGRCSRWLKRGCAVGVVLSVLVMGLSFTTSTLVTASWRWSPADDGLLYSSLAVGGRRAWIEVLREDPFQGIPGLWVVEEPAPKLGWDGSWFGGWAWGLQRWNWHEALPLADIDVTAKGVSFAWPTWSPVAFFIAGFTILHRRDRRLAHRLKHNLCTRCGYSRAGIAEGAKCPECGGDPANTRT